MPVDGGDRNQRVLLYDAVYQTLKRLVLTGELRPGEPLSEPQLAEQFGTSRSPIREAIRRLERDGLLRRAPNGRAVVASVDLADLNHVYTVRAVLEALAAKLAVNYLTSEDFHMLSEIVDKMGERAEAGEIRDALECGRQFHERIIQRSQNPHLITILEGLRTHVERYRNLVAAFTEYDLDRVLEHREILTMLAARNPDGAADAMYRHVMRSACVLARRLTSVQGAAG